MLNFLLKIPVVKIFVQSDLEKVQRRVILLQLSYLQVIAGLCRTVTDWSGFFKLLDYAFHFDSYFPNAHLPTFYLYFSFFSVFTLPKIFTG